MDVHITKLDESQPHQLFEHYSGQTKPQDAYISLDLSTGAMEANVNGEIGNAVPGAVWHGVVRRWYMPPFLAETANRIMDTVAPMAQRVLDGATVDWDGSNIVGRLDQDAVDASGDIGIEINTWISDTSEDICWRADDDWYHDAMRSDVTDATTDAEIEQMMDQDNTPLELPAAVIDREVIARMYREYRDGLGAEA